MILEGDYLVEHRLWPIRGRRAALTRPIGSSTRALLRAGIDVITDLNPEIFHQKFIVRDPG